MPAGAVEHITGNPLPAIRLAGESLFKAGKGLYDIARIFTQRR